MLEYMDIPFNNYECLKKSVERNYSVLTADILAKIRNKRAALVLTGTNVGNLLTNAEFVAMFSKGNDIATLVPPNQLFPKYLARSNIVLAYIRYHNDLHKFCDINEFFSSVLREKNVELGYKLVKKYKDELKNKHLLLHLSIDRSKATEFLKIVSHMTDLTVEERYSVVKHALVTNSPYHLYEVVLSSPEFDPRQDEELRKILAQ